MSANLEGANLWSAALIDVDCTLANLKNANLKDALLYGANFTDATLTGTILER